MKRKYELRNQYGMATWLKILLSLFGAGLLITIVVSILAVNFFKDIVDPKKTEAVAKAIVTLSDPLPPPFEYGRMNLSLGGYSVALITNTASKVNFFIMQSPRKDAATGAEKRIDEIVTGVAALPDARGGGMPGRGAGAIGKTTLTVDDKGVMDVAGSKLYFVIGKANVKPRTGAIGEPAPVTLDTFLGAVDPKDPQKTTIIMAQQDDHTKHLSLEEVKSFLEVIQGF